MRLPSVSTSTQGGQEPPPTAAGMPTSAACSTWPAAAVRRWRLAARAMVPDGQGHPIAKPRIIPVRGSLAGSPLSGLSSSSRLLSEATRAARTARGCHAPSTAARTALEARASCRQEEEQAAGGRGGIAFDARPPPPPPPLPAVLPEAPRGLHAAPPTATKRAAAEQATRAPARRRPRAGRPGWAAGPQSAGSPGLALRQGDARRTPGATFLGRAALHSGRCPPLPPLPIWALG